MGVRLHSVPPPNPTTSDACSRLTEQLRTTDPVSVPGGLDSASYTELHEALAGLPLASQELIEQLFWQERREAELANELGISHQAVNKRKQAILRHLAQWV